MPSTFANLPASPVTSPSLRDDGLELADGILELMDGSAYRGISFGAEGKSIAGECVFQTGMLSPMSQGKAFSQPAVF